LETCLSEFVPPRAHQSLLLALLVFYQIRQPNVHKSLPPGVRFQTDPQCASDDRRSIGDTMTLDSLDEPGFAGPRSSTLAEFQGGNRILSSNWEAFMGSTKRIYSSNGFMISAWRSVRAYRKRLARETMAKLIGAGGEQKRPVFLSCTRSRSRKVLCI